MIFQGYAPDRGEEHTSGRIRQTVVTSSTDGRQSSPVLAAQPPSSNAMGHKAAITCSVSLYIWYTCCTKITTSVCVFLDRGLIRLNLILDSPVVCMKEEWWITTSCPSALALCSFPVLNFSHWIPLLDRPTLRTLDSSENWTLTTRPRCKCLVLALCWCEPFVMKGLKIKNAANICLTDRMHT